MTWPMAVSGGGCISWFRRPSANAGGASCIDNGTHAVTFGEIKDAELRAANASGILKHGAEYRLQVRRANWK